MFHDFVSDKTDATSKYINNWHPEYTFGRFAHKCLRNINRVGRLVSSIASSVMSIMALAQNLTMNSPIMQALSWLNIGTFIFNQLSAVTWWGSNIAGTINIVVKNIQDVNHISNLQYNNFVFKDKLFFLSCDQILNIEDYDKCNITVLIKNPNDPACSYKPLGTYLLEQNFRLAVNQKKDQWGKDLNILENTWNFLSR
jgi:hypothetical protein